MQINVGLIVNYFGSRQSNHHPIIRPALRALSDMDNKRPDPVTQNDSGLNWKYNGNTIIK
jgi:hypothetical protein